MKSGFSFSDKIQASWVRGCLLLFISIFCIAFLDSQAYGQKGDAVSNSTESSAEPIAQSTPQLISLPSVLPNLEELNRFVSEAGARVEDISVYVQIKNELPELAAEFEDRLNSVNALSSSRLPTLDQIAELEKAFNEYSNKIKSWNATLLTRADYLNQTAERLKQEESTWKLSFAEIKKSERVLVIESKVKESLLDMRQLIKICSLRLNQVLALQSSLVDLSARVENGVSKVLAVRKQIKSGIFRRQGHSFLSKGFWLAFLSPKQELGVQMSEDLAEIVQYLLDNPRKVVLHVFLTLLFLFFLYRTYGIASEVESLKPIFGSPVLLLLTTSLLVGLVVFNNSPPALYHGIGLLLVWPVVLLLKRLIDRRFFVLCLGVGTLYFLDRVRALLSEARGLNDAILLIETLLAIGLCIRLVRYCDCSKESESGGGKRFLPLVEVFGRILAVLFSISFLAYLTGFVQLSYFVTQGSLTAVYNALLFFVIYKIVLGLWVSVMEAGAFSKLELVKSQKHLLVHRMSQILVFALTVGWGWQIVWQLGIESEFKTVFDFVLNIGFDIHSFPFRAKTFLTVVVLMFVAFKLSSMLRFVLEEDVYPRYGWDKGVSHTVNVGVHYFLIVSGVLLALSVVGLDLQNFALIAGALSVGIGFGLQNLVNNFVSGVIILAERPIKLGDLISISDTLGNVSKIGMRATTIRTLDDSEIIVPNGQLVSEQLINWTHSSLHARIRVGVGVAYGTDMKSCIQVLQDAAISTEGILEYPAPVVLFMGFGDSSLNFEVRAWIKNVTKRPKIESDLLISIHAALEQHGIEVPFPQRDVHIYNN